MDNPALFLLPLLGVALFGWSMVSGARSLRSASPQELAGGIRDQPLAIVVINPSKFAAPDDARATITSIAAGHGWRVRFFETTVDDPGFGQGRKALSARPDMVLACGGDGTVRAVAQSLAATSQRMGILPAGTGNLLARNLELPLDLAAAVDAALTGTDREIDVGWVSLDGGDQQAFLVMAGVGYDAEIMADAPELKAKVGGAAYVVSGVRKLNGKQQKVRLQLGGRVLTRTVRTVLIGNCGKLPGGIDLMPNAKIDDGILDVLVLSPKGMTGWASLAAKVIARKHHDHPAAEQFHGPSLTVSSGGALIAQVDGDPIGETRELRAWVEPKALTLRVTA